MHQGGEWAIPPSQACPLSLRPFCSCRSREEKGSHDLCRRCRIPPGLPHPGRHRRPRGPTVPRQQQRGLHVILAGPSAQLCGRQKPGGPEQHPQGGHRASARRHHGPPEKQVLQQPQQHVTGLPRCRPTATTKLLELQDSHATCDTTQPHTAGSR